MAREERSRVHKRRRGCLTGCLTRLLLLLGVFALVFVGVHVLGMVRNDPQTGAPSISFDHVKLPEIEIPDFSETISSLPPWPYSVHPSGMTVKTLRAGKSQAVLICADGYTLLCGEGGALVYGQMLLSRVNRLSAAVVLGSSDAEIGGMPLMLSLARPEYLFYQDSQIKGKAYQKLMTEAQRTGTKGIVPEPGFSFTLGRARVTFIGPARKHHTESGDDNLSLRVDYGGTSVLLMGGGGAGAEREIVNSGVPMRADALIALGNAGTLSLELVNAVQPRMALLTGKMPENSVQIRLQRIGTQVFTAKEYGVMTLFSDGQNLKVVP